MKLQVALFVALVCALSASAQDPMMTGGPFPKVCDNIDTVGACFCYVLVITKEIKVKMNTKFKKACRSFFGGRSGLRMLDGRCDEAGFINRKGELKVTRLINKLNKLLGVTCSDDPDIASMLPAMAELQS